MLGPLKSVVKVSCHSYATLQSYKLPKSVSEASIFVWETGATVEPLYNGHPWDPNFVRYNEVSLSQGFPVYFR